MSYLINNMIKCSLDVAINNPFAGHALKYDLLHPIYHTAYGID